MDTDLLKTPAQLRWFGRNLLRARVRQDLSQTQLATLTSLDQPAISRIELGERLPTLAQWLELAQVLKVSLQWFLTGSNSPGAELRDIALELQDLGIVDLFVDGAVVPGAFRPSELVVVLALSEDAPEPRIVEALPAVLAWNAWNISLFQAYSDALNTLSLNRIAWLSDIALTIQAHRGFPGGCPARKELSELLKRVPPPKYYDNLGRSSDARRLPPVSKRWKIGYPAALNEFRDRASQLHKTISK